MSFSYIGKGAILIGIIIDTDYSRQGAKMVDKKLGKKI